MQQIGPALDLWVSILGDICDLYWLDNSKHTLQIMIFLFCFLEADLIKELHFTNKHPSARVTPLRAL